LKKKFSIRDEEIKDTGYNSDENGGQIFSHLVAKKLKNLYKFVFNCHRHQWYLILAIILIIMEEFYAALKGF
jgi:hypothetical protein